jgi:hypothetical protein
MKKAVLKGAVVVAILSAWLVLPNIGAHAAASADCEAGAAFAQSNARLRDLGVPRRVALAQVAESDAPAKLKSLMSDVVGAVYNEPELTPEEARAAFIFGCTKRGRTKGAV